MKLIRPSLIKPSRRAFIAAAPAIIMAPSIAEAWWQSIQQVGVSGGGGGGYVGPGDVVSGASAWWGLRAYSNATTGGNAVDVFGVTTVTTFTFVTKSDGTLELSAGGAAAFITANSGVGNMRISQLYDQTGNGHHLTAPGVARPVFLTSGLGSFAVAQFNAAGHKMATASGFAVAQPFSIAAVAMTTASGAVQCLLSDSTGVQFLLSTTPKLRMQANTALDGATLTTSTWYSLQGLANGASSVSCLNGSDTSGSAGTNGIISGHVLNVGNDDFGEVFSGSFVEEGVWPSGFSSGNRSSMSSNQRTFWSI